MTAVTNPIEEDYKELKKKHLDLEAEKSLIAEKLLNAQKEISKLKKKAEVSSEPRTELVVRGEHGKFEKFEQVEAHPEAERILKAAERAGVTATEAKGPHSGHAGGLTWKPKFCDSPSCDDSAALNLEFKDETECRDCGLKLGEEKNLLEGKVARCPNCSGHEYRRLR